MFMAVGAPSYDETMRSSSKIFAGSHSVTIVVIRQRVSAERRTDLSIGIEIPAAGEIAALDQL